MRSLVHLHGGTLDIESRIGEGTSVHVTLPHAVHIEQNELAAVVA